MTWADFAKIVSYVITGLGLLASLIRLLLLFAIGVGIGYMLIRSVQGAELSYQQCLAVEQQSGNPCVYKTPISVTFGFGSTPEVNGSGPNFWGLLAPQGALYRAKTDRIHYEMDGTPKQCIDPCSECQAGGCKYLCNNEHVCHWEGPEWHSTKRASDPKLLGRRPALSASQLEQLRSP